MSSELPPVQLTEEKRGKKRTLDEIETNTIEPNPKRRKISTQTENHIILQNDDNENSTNNNNNKIQSNSNHTNSISTNNSINNNNNNSIKPIHKIPNAISPNPNNNTNNSTNDPPKPDPPIIDLIDLSTPPIANSKTNTPDIEMKDTDTNNTNTNTIATDTNHNNVSIIRPDIDQNKFYDYLSIYTDERCLIHAIPDLEISDEFNERPARLQALIQMVRDEQWNKHCRFISCLNDPQIPTIGDIEGLHSPGYLNDLKNSCSKIYKNNWNVAQGSDTYVVKQTFDAALISAGLVIEATKYVFSHIPPIPFTPSLSVENNTANMDMDIDDKDKNSADSNKNMSNNIMTSSQTTDIIAHDEKKYAVVLNRPPGHHCDGEKYSGYCYINNIAVAIEKQLNVDTRVLVLDVDVHHGDGTQKLFYAESTVLTVSFHEYDGTFFPSSGLRTEYGPSRRHAAYGTNINMPLDCGASDLDVLYALRLLVWPIVRKFKPHIAYYACGTDGVANDKANNSTIFTPNVYGQIAYELREYVNLIVVTTEGGYTTQYLRDGMSAVLNGLSGQIDTQFYPSELKQSDILASTVHNVAATTSDLRRVYDLESDPNEINKIFNKSQQLSQGNNNNNNLNGSMYIPNDLDYNDSDSDMNDDCMDDDDEFRQFEQFDDDDMIDMDIVKKKKKHKKEKKKNKKKHKKHKQSKHKSNHKEKESIDLTSDEKCNGKKKHKKKHKKHHKKKQKKKEKRIVSKCIEKKQKKKENIEIINLIDSKSNSPMANINGIENIKKKKKKKKKKHKDKHRDKDKDRHKNNKEKKKKKKKSAKKVNNNCEIVNNQNQNNMCTLSNIIGNGLLINNKENETKKADVNNNDMNNVNNENINSNDKKSSSVIVIE